MCTCLGISFVAAILSVESILVIHFLADNNTNNYADYNSKDTSVIPYNYRLCQGLTLTSNFDTKNPSASLFLLKTPPTLNGSESFLIQREIDLDEATSNETWAVNLYPGSNVSVLVCGGELHLPVVFYVIKGSDNYSRWSDDPNVKYSILSKTISGCVDISYDVSESDEYYLIVYQSNTTIGSSLNVTLKFFQTKYTYTSSSIAASCAINSSLIYCSLGVPMSSGYSALLLVNETTQWGQPESIGVNCNPRVWVYVMATLAIALFLILVFNGILLGCVYSRTYLSGRRHSYQRIN